MSETDQGWEAYWRNYGKQSSEWADQAKKADDGLHMPRQVLAPVGQVERRFDDETETWRDREPLL